MRQRIRVFFGAISLLDTASAGEEHHDFALVVIASERCSRTLLRESARYAWPGARRNGESTG
jgi:hypothetical protein